MHRRDLLRFVGISPLLLSALPAVAASESRKVALVVGNDAYRMAPLLNPGNDAHAMNELLSAAGFAVDLRLNIGQNEFVDAISRFRQAVSDGARIGVFYFAGHGVQLAWRNYLLPVDAVVGSADEVRAKCIDLGDITGWRSRKPSQALVVILDACRDNPFGKDFAVDRPGLSQHDAPAGTLLAYATAPGSVAADGRGRHGLYTQHLLNELAVPDTDIEDALKRVRLNVRLASNGMQIPWESTSLEDRVVLVGQSTEVAPEELERRFEAELTAFTQVQGSSNVEDWAAYIRRFPGGRFAEIAQLRIDRLLATGGAVTLAAATPPSPAVAPSTDEAAAKNPYSAGKFGIVRGFEVGDEFVYEQTDTISGVREATIPLRVTRVDVAADRVEFNGGEWISDLGGNIQKTGSYEYTAPVQMFPAELQVGRKWSTRFVRKDNGVVIELAMRLPARETIRVPAGEFDAFRIEGTGWSSKGGAVKVTFWVAPGIRPFYVKREVFLRSGRGQVLRSERHELVSHRP